MIPGSPRKDKPTTASKKHRSAAKKDMSRTLLSKSPNTTSNRMLFLHNASVQEFRLEKENQENSLLDATAKVSQLQNENEKCAFQLGEQDIEMERMKTTLFALN